MRDHEPFKELAIAFGIVRPKDIADGEAELRRLAAKRDEADDVIVRVSREITEHPQLPAGRAAMDLAVTRQSRLVETP